MSEEKDADDAAAGRGPFGRTLDVFLFAPLGVAMNIKEDLPGLIEKGRDRVEQEISNARVAGEYLVGRIQRRLSDRIDDLLHSGDGAVAEAPAKAAPAPPVAFRPPARPAPAPDAADAATLGAALADYDTLSASQVVRRLEGLGSEELRAVQRYEAATRNRRTILNRAGQLLEEGPAAAPQG